MDIYGLDRYGYAASGPTAPMHVGLKQRALCAPPLVSPVISRGAPRQTTCETYISERWNYGREMVDQILSTITTSTEIVGIFLHAANLRHGADGFTSPSRQGMLWIFLP